jgi:Interleukin-like EMT inducer
VTALGPTISAPLRLPVPPGECPAVHPRPSIRHLAAVLLFFLATTTFYTYPLMPRLATAIMPGVGDYPSETALIAWYGRYAFPDPTRLFDTRVFYPYANTQSYWQSVLVPGLLATPVLALTGQPLLATNAVVVLALATSGVLTYALAWSLTGRVAPSLLAGVVFAHFPDRLDHLGSPIVQMGWWLPVILWAATRFLADAGWRPLLVLVAALWAQMLSSLYYGFAVGLLLPLLGAAWVLRRPTALSWTLAGKGAVGVVALAVLLVPFLWPYLAIHGELGYGRSVGDADLYGMDLLSVLDLGQLSFNRLYPTSVLPGPTYEGGLFPGFILLALVTGFVLVLWRDGAAAATSPPRRLARRLLLAAAVLCVLLMAAVPLLDGIRLTAGGWRLLRIRSLTLPVALFPVLALGWVALEPRRRGPLTTREWGVMLLPLTVFTYLLTLAPTLRVAGRPSGVALARWVHDFVPGGEAFRAPGRWVLVFVLPLALLGALALARVQTAAPHRAIGIIVLAGIMAEYTTAPIPWQTLPPPPPVVEWLTQQPGDFAIAEFPTDDPWAMLWATAHGKRLVTGAPVFVPPGLHELIDAEQAPDPRALVTVLRSIYPLPYAVVHHNRLPPPEAARWAARLADPAAGLAFVERVGQADVLAVAGTPDAGVDLHRYVSSDYLRRHPVAAYAFAVPDTDGQVRQWVEVTFNGSPLGQLGEGAHAIRLPGPYRAADRNDLRFTHHYAVRSDVVAADPSYRVGQTGVSAPVDLEVMSLGRSPGHARIRVNGLDVALTLRRGYNVLALEPGSGALLWAESFDTFRAEAESRRMGRRIEALPAGTLVVATVKTDGGGQLEAEGVRALRSVGGESTCGARSSSRTPWLVSRGPSPARPSRLRGRAS